jgi:hypothetical protein
MSSNADQTTGKRHCKPKPPQMVVYVRQNKRVIERDRERENEESYTKRLMWQVTSTQAMGGFLSIHLL